MACWWITEAIPIAATSFVPLVLFPVTGVLNAKDTAANFGQSFGLLFLCSFIIARAIEHNELHRRIALSIIRRIGTSRKRVLTSCMIATAGLSMWLSNMAVSLMMLPIGVALLSRDEGEGKDSFATALVLSIAYAATIGGVATLVGTPPNLVFAGMLKELFPVAPEITFVKWLIFGLPLTAFFLPVACPRRSNADGARRAQEVERESVRRVPEGKGGLSMQSPNIASFVTNESPQRLSRVPAPSRNVFMQYARVGPRFRPASPGGFQKC